MSTKTLKIVMKSGKTIEVDENFVRRYMQGAIYDYVEANHAVCSCSLNEANSCCDCDGGLTDDNFSIKEIVLS